MNEVEPVEVLRYARDVVLEDESKWIKGALTDVSAEEEDEDTKAHVPLAKRFCAFGAVARAEWELTGTCAAQSASWVALAEAAPLLPDGSPHHYKFGRVSSYNDDPETSFSDVIDLFDLAIKRAEEA